MFSFFLSSSLQTPNPAPLTTFQGSPLTHEVAEGLFVGWLKGAKAELKTRPTDLIPSSWRVFAGKNPAYDYFPCQFQLFYPGKAKGSFWYQPVFKVLTIDGHKEWRQRLYRVRRDKTPGTFFLSVLDNGVTSLERWSIVDCDEGLEWCVFYYRQVEKLGKISSVAVICLYCYYHAHWWYKKEAY